MGLAERTTFRKSPIIDSVTRNGIGGCYGEESEAGRKDGEFRFAN